MQKQEFNIILGKFIQHKRKQKNWSQPDLSEKINNNFQNVSRLERGLTSPTLYWLEEVAKAFELELGELITEFDTFRKENTL